ncbi:MAG TPA: trypsin-like serine protease [Thermoanaerobaculia bacterium]|jgi:secreted trypsin-like serine protease
MHKLLVFVGAALLAASLPAGAITYGQPDGNGHPNVGAIVAEYDVAGRKDLFCSGTLISPTVFLTAAHCTSYLEANGLQAWVTFDSEYTSRSKIYAGTMHTNPGYNFAQDDPGDIAVIVLDRPVRGITPASLPSAGMLDRMAADGSLHQGSRFTAVGYGVHQVQVGGGPYGFPYDNLRWVAVSEFNSLNPAWLRLSQVGPKGDGGTCYGDSGGPNFLGAGASETPIVAGITVTGDALCLATNVTYRLDTPAARAFLSQFVTLP